MTAPTPPLLALALLAAATPAAANDTMAELAAGGLVFTASEHVAMTSEDLYLSEKEVRVDYVFRNDGDSDVSSVVAFPMPDVEGSGDFTVAIPDETSDNFMDFSATVDGRPVDSQVDRHAFASEVDVTAPLAAAGVPLLPFGEATSAALGKLPKATLDDFVARGMIVDMAYDDGTGVKSDLVPLWRLKTTYWWRTTFPAGRDLRVSHRYRPSVGATVGLAFVSYEGKRFSGAAFDAAARKYCFDDVFLKAVSKRLDAAGADATPLYQSWLGYVLTTGRNWGGTIGRFHLTVDKGTPDTLVSFCGKGVRKTGPTTFEMSAEDFYPEADIDVVLLRKPAN